MEPLPDPPEADREDEVGRQRTKRRAALLSRPVPGCPTMTLAELAEQVLAASAAGDADGAKRYLAEAGHSRETIEVVLGCLGLDGAEAGNAADVGAIPERASSQERLRTLAQLEALLLKE